jgi:trehalose 6-phosphate synthase/phosphatase
LIRNSQLQIIDGNKVIEIRVAGISKGSITKKLTANTSYDFVIAFGDDKTDEDMFRILEPDAFTIKVGKEYSAAQYYVKNHMEVIEFLIHLASLKNEVVKNPTT